MKLTMKEAGEQRDSEGEDHPVLHRDVILWQPISSVWRIARQQRRFVLDAKTSHSKIEPAQMNYCSMNTPSE